VMIPGPVMIPQTRVRILRTAMILQARVMILRMVLFTPTDQSCYQWT
jgi:hypothetical protein